MALQLETIAGKRRLELIKLGKAFSSEDTLEQARKTLKAHGVHGAKLKKHGFRSPDAAELQDAAVMLEGMEPMRQGKKGQKRTLRKGYVDVVENALAVRMSCRNEVKACRNTCQARGQDEATRVLDAAYEQTRRAPRTAKKVAEQFQALHSALSHPAVAPVVTEREADDILAEVKLVIPRLLAAEADVANSLGTPEETETMDLLDGIIVTHARAAYEAAKAAAKELGVPALAKEFETDLLYRSRGKGGGSTSEGTGTPAGGSTAGSGTGTGSTAGGSTGGSTAGGSTGSGSTAAGSSSSGSTAGGSTGTPAASTGSTPTSGSTAS